MSEPFSVAASAVGVVSLGLQVCQHLVTYCQAYKSYDEDVERISNTARGVKQPLKDLRDLIEETQATNPEIAVDLGEKALSLQGMIDNLKKAIDQFKHGAPDNFAEKVKGHLSKAVYPFRRATLRDMLQDLNGMQAVLQTTLSMYSTRTMRRVEIVSETLLQEVKQIRLDVQGIHTKGLPPPALMKSWCDEHNDYARLMKHTHIQSYTTPLAPNTSETECTVFGCTMQHRNYLTRKRNKGLVRSYKYLSTVLRIAITASFSMSTGAGGFSIAPGLTIRTTLRFEGSCPQLLFDRLTRPELESGVGIEEATIRLIDRLQRAFAEGEAAPSALYHQTTFLSLPLVDILCWWFWLYQRTNHDAFRTLIRFLVDHGSLPDNSSRFGILTLLISYVSWEEEDYKLACYLIEHGGPWTPDLELTLPARLNIEYFLSKDESLISIPDIARIIIQKSEKELVSALETRKITLNEKVLGVSLLKLSIGWPEGTQLLLAFGANPREADLSFWKHHKSSQTSPFFKNCYLSYKILLDAGYEVCGWDLIQNKDLPKLLSLLLDEFVKQRRRLCKLARSCLSEGEIQDFELDEYGLPDIHASDICKAIVNRGKDIDVSRSIRPYASSIYHEVYSFPTTMDALYNAGFKEFDLPDSKGVTPLMMACVGIHGLKAIYSILWFVSNGADVRRLLPHSSTTVTHLLSVGATTCLLSERRDSKYRPTEVTEELLLTWRDRLLPVPSIKDNCICACSLNGCTTFTTALRCIMRLDYWQDNRDTSFEFRRLLAFLVDWTQPGRTANPDLIRSLTFDAMGLKHTCCTEIDPKYVFDRPEVENMIGRDTEELAEIAEENKAGIEVLEQLIIEFEAKFNELNLSIWEFLEGYWHTRMVEYLCERDPYDEEHDRDSRRMGVFLRPEESDPLDRVSLIIGGRVKQVESETDDSEESAI